MAKIKTYKLSTEFITKLAGQTAGLISPGEFDNIINAFESEISNHFFNFSAESNLLRILLNMYDKAALLTECLKYPNYIEILVSVAANSNYLTDIFVRNPGYFYWIANPSTLNFKLDLTKSDELVKNTLASYKSFQSKVNSLRSLKRKEILRIGIRDILNKAGLPEITEELSVLAKSITAGLFELCYNEILNKYSVKNTSGKYCLIALGKLGGNELNYSSDIDLIIFSDNNFQLTKKKDFIEILTEAVYLFIECASSITSSGYIYRVDFRLRPDGKTSPLCRELSEYLDYYESRGEDWERQMLIKMDFIAGSSFLFNTFSSYIQNFIFPLSFSKSPVEQIKKLKADIEKKLDGRENIKLIAGGIRDIEFSVQVLQLLNGGRDKKLRSPNTIAAIKNLKDAGLLSESEAGNFLKSYVLYRKIEHYLQLMNDTQTHTIPQEGEMLHRLYSFLGFKSRSDFRHSVLENRKLVLKINNSILGIKSSSAKKDFKFADIKFRNKTKSLTDIQFLREGTGLLGHKQFDISTIENFNKIEPDLINYLEHSLEPDKILQNFVRVIRSAAFPSIWYKEFENKKFFNTFLQLCEFSQMSIDLFAENDDLREYFLTKKVFEKISPASIKEIKNNLHPLPAKKISFIICTQYSLGLINQIRVFRQLKNYFNSAIKFIAYGVLNKIIKETDYAIASLGSLGAGEMTFASDIDLIFIVEHLENYPEIQKDFQKLFLILKETFKPFDVDCRLRPEGKSSLLVWDLQSYKNYINTRACTWEFQSFCKLDFVCGNKKIITGLKKSIMLKIDGLDVNDLKLDILDMRKRLTPAYKSSLLNSYDIKKSSGGLTDIEFLLQFILLSDTEYFKRFSGKRIDQAIPLLIKADKRYNDLESLMNNFLFLKNLSLLNQVIFNSASSTIVLNDEKVSIIKKRMNNIYGSDFRKYFLEIVKLNQQIFEKYLKL